MAKKIKAVRPQVLSPTPDSMAEAYAAMIKRVVDERVAELMADKRGQEFRPFFEVREVSEEMRRRVSVNENRKWRYYFEEWGCMICERKDVAHQTLGMCARCHQNRQKRLRKIRQEHPAEPIPEFDSVARAQKALLPSIKALAKKATK